MQQQIRDYNSKLLFEIDVPNNLSDVWVDRYIVENAIKDKVCLKGAMLTDMNLKGVDFSGVDLLSTNLSCSDLSGAQLVEANCKGTDFRYAALDGANFSKCNAEEACLDQASLEGLITKGTSFTRATVAGGATLTGSRPIFQVGPLGPKEEYLVALVTDKGLRIKTRTFEEDFEEYKKRIDSTFYKTSLFYQEFQAAFTLIAAHSQSWKFCDNTGSQLSLKFLNWS